MPRAALDLTVLWLMPSERAEPAIARRADPADRPAPSTSEVMSHPMHA